MLRMPAKLIERLDAVADWLGVPRTEWIRTTLDRALAEVEERMRRDQ